MNYGYLRGLPDHLIPRLEIALINAEQAHGLTGHFGPRSAVNAVRAFVVQAFCDCAGLLCDAVVERHLPYLDLSPQLDRLRRAVIRDGFTRSDLRHWGESERGPSQDDFERNCNECIAGSVEWHAVQSRRLALAESAGAMITTTARAPVSTDSADLPVLAGTSTVDHAPFSPVVATTTMTARPTPGDEVATAATPDMRASDNAKPVQAVPERAALDLRTREARRAAVDAYIAEVYAKTERRIRRKDIWQKARYETRSEFERWQRCASNASEGSHERFVRILTDKPHLK